MPRINCLACGQNLCEDFKRNYHIQAGKGNSCEDHLSRLAWDSVLDTYAHAHRHRHTLVHDHFHDTRGSRAEGNCTKNKFLCPHPLLFLCKEPYLKDNPQTENLCPGKNRSSEFRPSTRKLLGRWHGTQLSHFKVRMARNLSGDTEQPCYQLSS